MKHYIDGVWMKDPANNNQPSVTLSLLIVAFIAALVASALHATGQIQSTSAFTEILWGMCATYLGRRISIGGKNFSGNEDKP